MEKRKALSKKEMIRLYKDFNIISPSDQALGRFAKMMGYHKKRIMKGGKTESWYFLNADELEA